MTSFFQLHIYNKIVSGEIKRQWQWKTNLLINGDRVRHRYFLGDGDSLDMVMVMVLCLMMIQSMPAIPQRWRDAHKQTHPHCQVHAHGGLMFWAPRPSICTKAAGQNLSVRACCITLRYHDLSGVFHSGSERGTWPFRNEVTLRVQLGFEVKVVFLLFSLIN